jgi:hypothetical protein
VTIYTLTLRSKDDSSSTNSDIRRLRWVLKTLLRSYDMQCISVVESTSTTLADLLTPLFVANPFSAVRTSFRRQSSDERDDGVADGRQAWLRRRSVDSFFPASLC